MALRILLKNGLQMYNNKTTAGKKLAIPRWDDWYMIQKFNYFYPIKNHSNNF